MSASISLVRTESHIWRARDYPLRIYSYASRWYVVPERQSVATDWLRAQNLLHHGFPTRKQLLERLADSIALSQQSPSALQLPRREPPRVSLRPLAPRSYLSRCGRARVEWDPKWACWHVIPAPGWHMEVSGPAYAKTLRLAADSISVSSFIRDPEA